MASEKEKDELGDDIDALVRKLVKDSKAGPREQQLEAASVAIKWYAAKARFKKGERGSALFGDGDDDKED